jgi:hypothetical protein
MDPRPTQPDDWRWINEAQFLRQCRWEAYRSSGPGGQKRNKTSSAVRMVHEPTGLSAIASESRAQSRNRAKALQRLRQRVVLEQRCPLDPQRFALPPWFVELRGHRGRLEVPRAGELYLPAVGVVMDVLAASGWSISAAAALLGIGTANLARFLEDDEKLWAKVNQMRSAAGLRTLVRRER